MLQEETLMADTGFGLSAQEYYYWAEGLANLVPVPDLPQWTPNFTGPSFIQIPEIDDSNLAVTGRAVDRSGNEVALSSATDTESPVSVIGNGSFEGQIQQAEYTGITEPRRYQMIVESADMPVSTEVTDAFGDGSTDGILTNFPATQPWVPVLGSSQAYLGNRQDEQYVNGVQVAINRLSSFPRFSGITGSWSENRPPVGSIVRSGEVVVQVNDLPSGVDDIDYAIANGTNDEIQAAFEYPNVFDIDVFDSATEAYNGNLTESDGANLDWANGINLRLTAMTSVGIGGRTGSYLSRSSEVFLLNSVLTSKNGASVRVNLINNSNTFSYIVITGTPEEIQEGFQWPNHFTVTPP